MTDYILKRVSELDELVELADFDILYVQSGDDDYHTTIETLGATLLPPVATTQEIMDGEESSPRLISPENLKTAVETHTPGLPATVVHNTGATFTGAVVLAGDGTADLHPVTVQQLTNALDSIEIPSMSYLEFGVLSANGATGIGRTLIAGESISFGQIVAVRNDSGVAKAYKYSCDSADTDRYLLAIGVAIEEQSAGDPIKVLREGFIRNSGYSLVAADTGKSVYAGTTDGAFSLTPPEETDTGDIV